MPTAQIGPSILNADLSQLGEECVKLLEQGADYLHLDVMDGNFVPNISIGPPVIKSLRPKVPNAILDVHLMVSKPEMWIEPMKEAGADYFTFHFEATDNAGKCIASVKKAGMKVGLAIKPNTPISAIEEFIPIIDIVLIMTVEPGFGGQKFMIDMMSKVEYIRKKYPEINIQVDGGVGPSTIEACAKAGANMVVSGSAIVKSSDPKLVMANMKTAIQKYTIN